MPTGYTHDVQTGKVTEFRDFALQCARAFGALIAMRDDPSDAQIPERFEPSVCYHDNHIEEAKHTLAELEALSPEECEERANAAYAELLAGWEARCQERREQRDRYENMLRAVEAWDPPTSDHTELKKFMEQQLTESIRFDCSGSEYDKKPLRVSGALWLEQRKAQAAKDLAYHTDERRKEVERTEGRNRWLADLRASLAEPAQAAE